MFIPNLINVWNVRPNEIVSLVKIDVSRKIQHFPVNSLRIVFLIPNFFFYFIITIFICISMYVRWENFAWIHMNLCPIMDFDESNNFPSENYQYDST